MTLVEFLEARLAEDEAAARDASGGGEESGWHETEEFGVQADVRHGRAEYPIVGFTPASAHIARHDPARVLREVDAKRRILAEFRAFEMSEGTVRALASVYADHPDYRKEWRP